MLDEHQGKRIIWCHPYTNVCIALYTQYFPESCAKNPHILHPHLVQTLLLQTSKEMRFTNARLPFLGKSELSEI